jgi:hypothetical protein
MSLDVARIAGGICGCRQPSEVEYAAARGALSLERNAEACMGDERAAQDQLANDSSQYSRAHETRASV